MKLSKLPRSVLESAQGLGACVASEETLMAVDNHELFILDKSELRLMEGPPAKINVADP